MGGGSEATAFAKDIVALLYIYIYTYVVPAHQTSDMSRSTISPESRSKLEMVILSSLRFRTI